MKKKLVLLFIEKDSLTPWGRYNHRFAEGEHASYLNQIGSHDMHRPKRIMDAPAGFVSKSREQPGNQVTSLRQLHGGFLVVNLVAETYGFEICNGGEGCETETFEDLRVLW